MTFKYKFGTPEVIAMVAGTLFLFGLGALMRQMGFPYVLEAEAVVVVLIAALFGIYAGGVVTVATTLVYIALLHVDTSFVHMAAYIVAAAGIGRYAADFGIREGGFKGRTIFDFVVIRLMVDIVIWIFFIPFFSFLTAKADLYDMIASGLKSLAIMVISDIILVPLFIAIRAVAKKVQKNKKGIVKQGLNSL